MISNEIKRCPVCKKMDIDPENHEKDCNPGFEAYRQESQEYYD